MNAIILHGRPSKDEYYDPAIPSASNDHWYTWLQKQLLINDIKADTPEVPYAFRPEWDIWVKEVERFEIDASTILIGHSTGAGFWVRYLSEHPELYVDKIVLVAPWLNVNHEDKFTFFDFDLDAGLVERVKELVVFESDNDAEDIQDTVTYLKEKFPQATFKDFHNYGHFCLSDMKTQEFPELLEVILA